MLRIKDVFCAAAGRGLSRTEAVGSGRACQRPRTSSGAKCFSCEGALAREIAFFKFLAFFKKITIINTWIEIVIIKNSIMRMI